MQNANLPEPKFIQEDMFRTIVYRKQTEQVTGQVTQLILLCNNELSRNELMTLVHLKGRDNFEKLYLQPALKQNLIERTIPEKPKSRNQKYRLTSKGLVLKTKLNKET